MLSIVDDFSDIGARLKQIEKVIPPKAVDKSHGQEVASNISTSWMYAATPPADAPVVYPMFGGYADTAPCEYVAPDSDGS
jgi:hypothetical protein